MNELREQAQLSRAEHCRSFQKSLHPPNIHVDPGMTDRQDLFQRSPTYVNKSDPLTLHIGSVLGDFSKVSKTIQSGPSAMNSMIGADPEPYTPLVTGQTVNPFFNTRYFEDDKIPLQQSVRNSAGFIPTGSRRQVTNVSADNEARYPESACTRVNSRVRNGTLAKSNVGIKSESIFPFKSEGEFRPGLDINGFHPIVSAPSNVARNVHEQDARTIVSPALSIGNTTRPREQTIKMKKLELTMPSQAPEDISLAEALKNKLPPMVTPLISPPYSRDSRSRLNGFLSKDDSHKPMKTGRERRLSRSVNSSPLLPQFLLKELDELSSDIDSEEERKRTGTSARTRGVYYCSPKDDDTSALDTSLVDEDGIPLNIGAVEFPRFTRKTTLKPKTAQKKYTKKPATNKRSTEFKSAEFVDTDVSSSEDEGQKGTGPKSRTGGQIDVECMKVERTGPITDSAQINNGQVACAPSASSASKIVVQIALNNLVSVPVKPAPAAGEVNKPPAAPPALVKPVVTRMTQEELNQMMGLPPMTAVKMKIPKRSAAAAGLDTRKKDEEAMDGGKGKRSRLNEHDSNARQSSIRGIQPQRQQQNHHRSVLSPGNIFESNSSSPTGSTSTIGLHRRHREEEPVLTNGGEAPVRTNGAEPVCYDDMMDQSDSNDRLTQGSHKSTPSPTETAEGTTAVVADKPLKRYEKAGLEWASLIEQDNAEEQHRDKWQGSGNRGRYNNRYSRKRGGGNWRGAERRYHDRDREEAAGTEEASEARGVGGEGSEARGGSGSRAGRGGEDGSEARGAGGLRGGRGGEDTHPRRSYAVAISTQFNYELDCEQPELLPSSVEKADAQVQANMPLIRLDEGKIDPAMCIKEARQYKYKGDATVNTLDKLINYIWSALFFMRHGDALGVSSGGQTMAAKTLKDTLALFKSQLAKYQNNDKPNGDKKRQIITILSCRMQAALHYRMYKLKRDDMAKAKLSVDSFCMKANEVADNVLRNSLMMYVYSADMLNRSHLLSEKAQDLSMSHPEFFARLDYLYGVLTSSSSVTHITSYMTDALKSVAQL